MKLLRYLILIPISLLLNYNLSGEEGMRIFRLPEPITLDGYPFEEAWNTVELFQLVQHTPVFGIDPSEKSEVMITYDNEFLYVGARLYIKDPSNISSKSKQRDEISRGSDSFGIILDTYDDNENALAFFTMPSGARIDYTISNDAVMMGGPGFGSSTNYSWNTFWDVKTTRDDKGWYVEMQIPFSSLRFKPQDDVVKMGLIINRSISYNNERDTYPMIEPKYGFTSNIKPSLAKTIEFQGVRPSKPVYVTPYIIGGFSRDNEINPEETQYVRKDNPEFNIGLDVKYSLNSNLTLDLTANTDFAQVESDDQQVNLTRYSLFFPEKRLFFQERSSLLSFNLGGPSELFYSRNIGIIEEDPVRIYGGARLTGRIAGWDIGMMDMQTEKYNDSIPSENFSVFRMRRQVINPNSYVGGIFTSKIGMNGDYNFAYGLDGLFRLFGDDYLDIKLAQTYDNEFDNAFASMKPTFFRINWERRSEKGFAYDISYTYSGEQFAPGIGFLQRVSDQGARARFQYGWFPGEQSRLFSHGFTFRSSYFTRLSDGKLESFTVEPGYEFRTKSGYGVDFSGQFQKEGVEFDFEIADKTWVRAGEYAFYNAQSRIFTPFSKPVSAMIMLEGGQFYDGHIISAMIRPMFNISASLQLSGSYQFNAIYLPGNDQQLTIHTVSARALYMFNTKLSASILIQYVNTNNDLIGNFRLRYNPREGNDLYLVYNEYRPVGYTSETVEIPAFYTRTIMLKYTHTFRL
jgi:hypothetical protein